MIHLHKVQNQVKLNCSGYPEKSGILLPLEEEKKNNGNQDADNILFLDLDASNMCINILIIYKAMSHVYVLSSMCYFPLPPQKASTSKYTFTIQILPQRKKRKNVIAYSS